MRQFPALDSDQPAASVGNDQTNSIIIAITNTALDNGCDSESARSMWVAFRSPNHGNVGSQTVACDHSNDERCGRKRDEFQERRHGYVPQYREP